MPELPEVERAAKLLRDVAQGKVIEDVETSEDTIVYAGVTHDEFAREVKGRKVLDVKRHGKIFYIVLEGDGRMPVLHFGMTGMIQVQGQEPTWYQQRPKDAANEWPPRFMKFVLHIAATEEAPAAKIAFRDARRLGRIRLCASPAEELPISGLGFDPILSMPSAEAFAVLVKKRNVPVKALLLDQEFSAGIGNWVADEVLFQSRIHPERRANALEDSEIETIREKIIHVCRTAIDVNADASQFPITWLFPHRWGKGKKVTTAPLILPDGRKANIKFITVGGRTSAIVEQVQKLSSAQIATPSRKKRKARGDSGDESSELSDAPSELDQVVKVILPKKRAQRSSPEVTNSKEAIGDEVLPSAKKRKTLKAPRKARKAS